MANVGAVVAAIGGARDIAPSFFIPSMEDEEELSDEQRRAKQEREAKLRAADQRALLAALTAAFPKKPNGQ